MITTYNSSLPQSNAVLCLPIIPTILLSYYHDNTLYVAPTIANRSTHMNTTKVLLQIEINVNDYPDASLNQDTDNAIKVLSGNMAKLSEQFTLCILITT